MGGTGNGHMGAGNAGRGGFNNDGGGSGSDRPGFNDMKIGTWNDAPATSNAGNTSGNGNYPKSIHRDVVYDRNHYFGLGLIPKPKPKLADTFGRYRNHISKGKYNYR